MFSRRCAFWLCRFAASAVVVLACANFASPVRAQSGTRIATPAKPPVRQTELSTAKALQKNIGEKDGALFGGVLDEWSDGKKPLHVIVDTTADIKQTTFSGTITGRMVLRGNLGGAFAADHEMTVHQGEKVLTKFTTQVVCDGTTLWIYRPSTKQYTEQVLVPNTDMITQACRSASLEFGDYLGREIRSDFNGVIVPNSKLTEHVEMALFHGTPCRVLTIAYNGSNEFYRKGSYQIYVGLDKRLRGLQLRGTGDNSSTAMTEMVKLVETIPPPDKSVFTFTPPEGAVKVDKFGQ